MRRRTAQGLTIAFLVSLGAAQGPNSSGSAKYAAVPQSVTEAKPGTPVAPPSETASVAEGETETAIPESPLKGFCLQIVVAILSVGLLLFGTQLVIAGLIAELIVDRGPDDLEPYCVADRTPEPTTAKPGTAEAN